MNEKQNIQRQHFNLDHQKGTPVNEILKTGLIMIKQGKFLIQHFFSKGLPAAQAA